MLLQAKLPLAPTGSTRTRIRLDRPCLHCGWVRLGGRVNRVRREGSGEEGEGGRKKRGEEWGRLAEFKMSRLGGRERREGEREGEEGGRVRGVRRG